MEFSSTNVSLQSQHDGHLFLYSYYVILLGKDQFALCIIRCTKQNLVKSTLYSIIEINRYNSHWFEWILLRKVTWLIRPTCQPETCSPCSQSNQWYMTACFIWQLCRIGSRIKHGLLYCSYVSHDLVNWIKVWNWHMNKLSIHSCCVSIILGATHIIRLIMLNKMITN